MGKVVKRIVLTGGPCAGKSTCLNDIKLYLESIGYLVYVVPETATVLNSSGISLHGKNKVDSIDFQRIILNYQLNIENIYESIAETSCNDKIIIIYDRGILDGKAYIPYAQFDSLLVELGLVKEDLLERYDLVIHLETGAKVGSYTLENNEARTEDDVEAIHIDDITFDVWKEHRNLIKIHANKDFEAKKNEIINVVKDNLKVSKRIQNKYLININSNLLDEDFVNIKQYYLETNDNKEHRLRIVEKDNVIRYYYTIQKKRKNGVSLVISDKSISKDYFDKLLNEKNIIKEISKIRKCIIIDGIKCNIDLYDDGRCILESINEEIENSSLNVIENVTNKKEYLTANLVVS